MDSCVPRLKFSPQSRPRKPNSSSSEEINNKTSECYGGLSFIQALTNTSQNSKEVTEKDDSVYVHPLVKKSSSKLSPKSLEMCTESLGSESGHEFLTSVAFDESTEFTPRENCLKMEPKQLVRSKSFPPPLTSISCSGNVQVRPHREGGRLVIKAVPVSANLSCFEAERGGGRLRLRLLSGGCLDEEERNDGAENWEGDDDDVEDGHDDDDDEVDDCWGGDVEGNNVNVGGDMGTGKLPRPSRCMEGRPEKKGRLWEPLLVATTS